MKIVLDTSIVIDYLRQCSQGVQFFKEKRDITTVYLPTIVLFELFSGKSTDTPHIEKAIINFTKFFPKIELTEEISKRAGELFRDVNKNLGAADYIIAASALELNADIVTLNKKDFELIPNLKLYPL